MSSPNVVVFPNNENRSSYFPYPQLSGIAQLSDSNALPRLSSEVEALLEKSVHSLEKIEIANNLILSEKWLLYGFIRKEAVTSSQIEGTQSTLTDLLQPNKDYSDNPDLEEVSNYIAASQFALNEINRKNGLPISTRLLKETHKVLMNGTRGTNKKPGEFRNVQNWIGGSIPQKAVFVPPPPHLVEECLSDLEKFLHDDSGTLHPLLKISMAHVQFETIHPFLDGNGRLGRLLITLLLQEYNFQTSPILYLSLYFKRNRNEYYQLLNQVRFDSSWTAWHVFFLKGLVEVCNDVIDASQKLNSIFQHNQSALLQPGQNNINALKILHLLPENPILTANKVIELTGLAKPTVSKALSILEKEKILTEVTGMKKNRVYQYTEYLNVLVEDTHPII